MTVAAVWGVLQLFVLAWPTRSVRLTTVLLALATGVYGCGVATALIQLMYTRLYAHHSGHPLISVVNTTSYTVAPWLEELIKLSPLLLAGLSLKIRRQWGLTDFVLLGAALGAGFGLLEAVLRYALDAHRAIPRDGGWVIPDSLSPPYVPSLGRVLTSWLPAPFSQLDVGGAPATDTFTHLVFTAMTGFGAGLLWRARGKLRLLSALPIAAAMAYHTVNNYAVQHPTSHAVRWVETLDGKAWAAPLACLALAMLVDVRQLHRGKRTVPGILLTSERADGDSVGALLRYATWRLPWSLRITLRYVAVRRALLYATAASTKPTDTEELRGAVADFTSRINESDNQQAWQTIDGRTVLKEARAAHGTRRRWLYLIPCVLMLPALLFLVVGSFTSTAGLQKFFSTGAGPHILLGFGIAALAWIAYLLTALLRTWRSTTAHPLAEVLAAHRFRLGTALGSATTGTLLLWHSLGAAGPAAPMIRTYHLLDALNNFLTYLGFALLLLSLLSLFPPSGLALAGGGALGALTTEAALNAGVLGAAGVVLMAVGAGETDASDSSGGREGPPQWLRDKWNEGRQFNKDNWHRYPANEVYLENGKVLDSYRPGKEIVSRKKTQISKISKDTFTGYLREIAQKYKEGTKVPDTPKARREYPKLIGKPLRGRYYLEVPVQSEPVPEWALREAMNRDVIIRDVQGHVYQLPKGAG